MWKKFYKKATALALVCAMSVMLTACGDSNSSWKAASSSLENSVEDAIAAGNTEPEASPIDASSLEDCAYALPDPTGEEAKAEQERFHTYLMDNFKESVTSDTVTLHYTVANPAHYDLDVPTATFGDAEISEDAIASDKKETEDEITELQSFDYDLLTGSQKYTYDVIKDYLDLNLESYDYTYLYEPFAYTSGLQTNMPINMSEYKFYNEGDVQDYLALLGQLSDYYGKYLDFEQTKIDKWILQKLMNIMQTSEELHSWGNNHKQIADLSNELLRKAKVQGFSDFQIARAIGYEGDMEDGILYVRNYRKRAGILPVVKQIDTQAAEYPAQTNYLYLTYSGVANDVHYLGDHKSIVVLGSGAYRIGSSDEFD